MSRMTHCKAGLSGHIAARFIAVVLATSLLSAQEQLPLAKVKVGAVSINVNFGPGRFDVGQAKVLQWISNAAEAVAVYYGRFPVPHAMVAINPAAGRGGIGYGVTYGMRGGLTRISVGEHTPQVNFDNDWIMTHELTHLAFPDIAGDEREHHWIEEGMATYVEPIARCQAGQLAPERVWREMIQYMPDGLSRPGDRMGLDNDGSWGKTYWGGALFWLLADIGIREATQNRVGVQQAMRGILNAGGDIRYEWPIERVLQVGDRVTGGRVLQNLYAEMKDKPVKADLNAIWAKLGVTIVDNKVKFNDGAPEANIRRAITTRR